MLTRPLNEQLVKYLTDAHSIEEQALVQMRRAPDLAAAPDLAEAFRRHIAETENHEALVRARLEAHGAKPSAIKDAVMKLGGGGFTMFAMSQPDTPGKLAAHAFSYENLELASYALLERVATRSDDADTAEAARTIARQEQAMANRLEALFDSAVDAVLEGKSDEEVTGALVGYLADAHALEEQSLGLLSRARDAVAQGELRALFEDHFEESERQRRLVEERLEAHGAHPSVLKDAALRLGALNWALFFEAQPDTPGKLAAFAFAFEHLEIAGYEQLARVATRAGDHESAAAAERILGEEHHAASRLRKAFDVAVDASLDALAVARDSMLERQPAVGRDS